MQRVLAALAMLILVLTLVIAWSSLRMNLSELAWQLQKQEFVEGNLSRMYLIARFVDQRKLYLDQMDRSAFDHSEFELSRLLDHSSNKNWSQVQVDDYLDRVSLKIVNSLRWLVHKPAMATTEEIQTLTYLEIAFRLERNKEYRRALSIYEQTTPNVRDPLLMGMILLHEGYCQSLQGNIAEAKSYYLAVIHSNRDNDQGVTADLLLQHLDQILRERELIQTSSLPQSEKTRKLPLLMQCKEALHNLDPNSTTKSAERAEILMVQGLCEEEAGHKSQAIKKYLEAIRDGGTQDVARDANRRVFLIGTQMNNGQRVQAIAESLNKTLHDTLVEQMKSEEPLREKTVSDNVIEFPEPMMKELERTTDTILAEREKVRQNLVVAPLITKPVTATPEIKPIALHSFVKIILKNGKTFSGEVLSTPDENVLRIRTMIGIIGVRHDDILEMTSN